MNLPRIGQGYDVHRLTEGRALTLGGVTIPFEKGLEGHSDADVLLHALMDALLGAAALGDIGRLFPDSDDRYRGIDSRVLLRETARVLSEHGFAVGNVDVTLVAQRPKIAPYILQMRENIGAGPGRRERQGHNRGTAWLYWKRRGDGGSRGSSGSEEIIV